MSEARVVAHLPLLLFALVEVGCAPAPRAVRLCTPEGQVRVTTPAPRPPMVLRKEEVHRVVRALAKQENRALVIVTHDPKVRNIADRVVKIQDGALV
jgi:sRNA-binding carbon storage regulator CsrA